MLVKTVDIGDKEMDYLHFGKEDGEKLVILPGLSLKSVMESAEAIVPAYNLLAKNYDIYLFGYIKEKPEGYTIDDTANDILTAFDELGIEKANIMGVSMGGMIGQSLAAKAPDRVSSLILCSTAMNIANSDLSVFSTWENLAKDKNAPALMEAFGVKVYTPSFFEQYKDQIIASAEGTTDQDFSNFLVSLNAIRNFEGHKDINKISCPVYVIGAGEDRVLNVQSSYELINALNCKYYIYEGYGHGVYDEAPDYLTHIDEFLKEIKK